MRFGAVALVAREIVTRPFAVQIAHRRVARRFRQNRGGHNLFDDAVAADNRARRIRQIGREIAVDQDLVRANHNRVHRALHREHRRPPDIKFVDFFDRRRRHRVANRILANHRRQFLAPRRRQRFRIGESFDPIFAQRHRRREHRAGQSPATGFVDAAKQFRHRRLRLI